MLDIRTDWMLLTSIPTDAVYLLSPQAENDTQVAVIMNLDRSYFLYSSSLPVPIITT